MPCIFNWLYFTIYTDTGCLLPTQTLDENTDGEQRKRTRTTNTGRPTEEENGDGEHRTANTGRRTENENGDGGRKKRTVRVMREVGSCVC